VPEPELHKIPPHQAVQQIISDEEDEATALQLVARYR
jgi:hypothetical protein